MPSAYQDYVDFLNRQMGPVPGDLAGPDLGSAQSPAPPQQDDTAYGDLSSPPLTTQETPGKPSSAQNIIGGGISALNTLRQGMGSTQGPGIPSTPLGQFGQEGGVSLFGDPDASVLDPSKFSLTSTETPPALDASAFKGSLIDPKLNTGGFEGLGEGGGAALGGLSATSYIPVVGEMLRAGLSGKGYEPNIGSFLSSMVVNPFTMIAGGFLNGILNATGAFDTPYMDTRMGDLEGRSDVTDYLRNQIPSARTTDELNTILGTAGQVGGGRFQYDPNAGALLGGHLEDQNAFNSGFQNLLNQQRQAIEQSGQGNQNATDWIQGNQLNARQYDQARANTGTGAYGLNDLRGQLPYDRLANDDELMQAIQMLMGGGGDASGGGGGDGGGR